MPFWNTDNPKKPWGPFDPHAQLDIPFDWSDWLTEIGRVHAEHEVTAEDPLEVFATQQSAGIITAYIRVKAGGTPELGKKYWVKCQITTDGVPPRVDERTVYLKVEER